MKNDDDQRALVAPIEPHTPTLLEADLPFREISLAIKADRRALDPVYGVHRWWARRPPALLRAALLATAVPVGTTPEDFWNLYRNSARVLEGWSVYDPFLGGGCTLVEAARLGADVAGGDVDPLAVEIARYELDPAPGDAVRAAGQQLLDHLQELCGHLYPAAKRAEPLHYFWLHRVTCPSCQEDGLLYRNLVLARDAGKSGAVVRDIPLTVFCPEDLSLHELKGADRRQLRHRGRRWPLHAGTFVQQRYTCPSCGHRATHRELQTGAAPRVLVAVEETPAGERRRLRSPNARDRKAITEAADWLSSHQDLPTPKGRLSTDRHDDRPLSFGMSSAADLFTDRQLAVLGAGFLWASEADLDPRVRTAMRLALSNALATNNKLCSYAADYGRLSALFSVRGYSLPALPVELNPLHPQAGRGTIAHCVERVARASNTTVRRHAWSPRERKVSAINARLRTSASIERIRCTSASAQVAPDGDPVADACVFDPPYFDYIAYAELSEFYRSWLPNSSINGAPLLPSGEDPAEGFGIRLGQSLRVTLARLAEGRPIAFTYHSTNPDAWRAVSVALDEAKLRVTAMWPIRSDGHMGHHSHPGNCEWDLLVVCRRVTETDPTDCGLSVSAWVNAAKPLVIGEADQTSMTLALDMAARRFGTLVKESSP